MSVYRRPVLILSETKHEVFDEQGKAAGVEVWWEGSFRGPNTPGLESAKDFFESSGFTEYTAGHANAGGVGIKNKNIESFLNYCNNYLKDFDFTPKYKVDFILTSQKISEEKYDLYDLMQYDYIWGQEIPQPYIAVEGLTITKDNLQLFKGSTLKIDIPGEDDITLVKFKISEQEYENLLPTDMGCVTLNVIGVCEKNSYNDKPQIIIKDYEIINKQAYYF